MLTGKFHIEKRLLGGFNVFVEEKYMKGGDPYDLNYYYKYRKATIKEIRYLNIQSN